MTDLASTQTSTHVASQKKKKNIHNSRFKKHQQQQQQQHHHQQKGTQLSSALFVYCEAYARYSSPSRRVMHSLHVLASLSARAATAPKSGTPGTADALFDSDAILKNKYFG
jgi:hypothetical protein